MTDEEIAREAMSELLLAQPCPDVFSIILAAIQKAKSTDKARLDWLEHDRWIDLHHHQYVRDAIDAARKSEDRK